ncbi:oligosaccharyl transferase complex, subunit OST3/OST6 [Kipferlia bialata]|uniref:Oligosaccharyl transferase complex, subunit OST3/OST6 n=1 Tax=Kipferlia bialata TaxID=797122 RepID=A0A9K3GKH6_9EUKA|nr:oligosaccharyl transferase complex, subunit OST3/OST6 [Kipferlia bialata]|eukprot:g8045.t1
MPITHLIVVVEFIEEVSGWGDRIRKKIKPVHIFALCVLSYFLITAGVIYNAINHPPPRGFMRDEVTGQPKVITVMNRLTAQYAAEGWVSAFYYILASAGIILTLSASYSILGEATPMMSLKAKRDRKGVRGVRSLISMAMGVIMFLCSYAMIRGRFREKMPSYY